MPLERKYNYDGEAIKSQPGERSPFVVPTAAVFKWTHKKVEPTKTSFLLSSGSFFCIIIGRLGKVIFVTFERQN